MYNATDISQLRKEGMTNQQILENMAPVVPSAARALSAIRADKKTPAWQLEMKIGQMLDKGVPKNAPSGMLYMNAVGMNHAQKSLDSVDQQAQKDTAIQSSVQKNQNPEWLKWIGQAVSNTGKSLFDATQAPGNLATGLIDKGLSKIGVPLAGDTQEAKNLSKNAVDTLNNMPLYAGIVGGAFGMPGVGSSIGQGITEIGHNLMGDNKNTLLQQGADVALAGLQGKLLGSSSLGGATNVPGMMLKGAAGQAAAEAGTAIMGNNQNSLGQSAQNIVGAGLLTGGLTAGFNVAAPAVQGAMQGFKDNGVSGAASQGAQGALQGAQTVANQLNPFKFTQRIHSTPNIDATIQQQWDKAVRPGVGVKRTQAQINQYTDNVNLAVKELAANKDNLNLSTMEGERMPVGSLPDSLWTASQANGQMMEKLFSSWDNLKKITGGKGVTISSEPMAQALESIAGDKVMRTQYPQTAAFAESLAARMRTQLPEITMEQAQQMSQQWNNELQGYQRNAQPNDIANGTAIAAANNVLKKTLSDAIQGETDSPIYSELKRSYAAQKAIEADLNRRVAVFSRQNPKGLIDYTDIFSAGDALHALASLNPAYMASAAGKFAIKNWIKSLNNPDNMIKSMFKAVDSHVTGLGTPILQRASDVIQQNTKPQAINSSPASGAPVLDTTQTMQSVPPAGSETVNSPVSAIESKSPPTTIPEQKPIVKPSKGKNTNKKR